MADDGDDDNGLGFTLATVTCDFEAEAEVELSLKEGDVVQVLDMDIGDGWYEGTLEIGGKRGLFPAEFVDLLQPDSDDDMLAEKTDGPDPTPRESFALPPPPESMIFPSPPSPPRSMAFPSPPPPQPAATKRTPPTPPPPRQSQAIKLPSPPPPPKVAGAAATTPGTTPPTAAVAITASARHDSRVSALPAQESSLDPVTARKLLATGQAPCIVAGPKWFSEICPPVVRITNTRRESKLNGVKQFIVYDIESYRESTAEQPQSIVSRRYKHFLWLHESLIDLFPGVVIPPLPVKQFAGRFEHAFIHQRHMQLERFLNRLARSPLLRVSHAFTHFLTATSFENWKTGKNSVRHSVMYSKPSKPLDSPQYFYALSYPPNNVPYDRLLVVENFATFSKSLSRGTVAVHSATASLGTTYEELGESYAKLGNAMQSFAAGRAQLPARRVAMSEKKKTVPRSSSESARKMSSPSLSSSLRHAARSRFYSVAEEDDKKTKGQGKGSPPSTKKTTTTAATTPDGTSVEKSKFYSSLLEADEEKAVPAAPANRERRAAPPPPPPRPTAKPRHRKPDESTNGEVAKTDGADGGHGNTADGDNGGFVPGDEVENWSWKRTCTRFPKLMSRLHGVGNGLVKLGTTISQAENNTSATTVAKSPPAGAAPLPTASASMETSLKEYISLLQALPGIVRYHEDAIEHLNSAKMSSVQRDVLAQATRHAETCSNVVLAELDHFYDSLMTDMESMVASHLRHKMNVHKQMAEGYGKMLEMFEGED